MKHELLPRLNPEAYREDPPPCSLHPNERSLGTYYHRYTAVVVLCHGIDSKLQSLSHCRTCYDMVLLVYVRILYGGLVPLGPRDTAVCIESYECIQRTLWQVRSITSRRHTPAYYTYIHTIRVRTSGTLHVIHIRLVVLQTYHDIVHAVS